MSTQSHPLLQFFIAATAAVNIVIKNKTQKTGELLKNMGDVEEVIKKAT